ncbi:MAG: hypothetical protein KAH34_13775, partial [Ketobacter sp.]|nr:hypothetical protein [Ketobacter sp.]
MATTPMANTTSLSEAQHYLRDILGPEAISAPKINDWATPWTGAEHLPFFLQNAYRFYRAEL